jgi:hypothetical protein
VISDPPSNGATHKIITLALELAKVDGTDGVLGDVIISAPLLIEDTPELPNTFLAMTVT